MRLVHVDLEQLRALPLLEGLGPAEVAGRVQAIVEVIAFLEGLDSAVQRGESVADWQRRAARSGLAMLRAYGLAATPEIEALAVKVGEA